MTIEQEIAKREQPETDELFISDYSLESDEIVFYNDNEGFLNSFKYRDIMKDNYSTDNEIIENKLDDLKSSLRMVWDEDIESFELERVTDIKEDGEEFLKELQFNILIENEYNPETVLQVNNKNGDFIADDVKYRFRNDFNKSIKDMEKFKTDRLFVDNPTDSKSIYEKEEDYIGSFKKYVKQKNHLLKSIVEDISKKDNITRLDYTLFSALWILIIGYFGFITVPLISILSIIKFFNREYKESKKFISYIFAPLIFMYYIIYHLLKPFYSGFTYKKELVKLK